MSPALLPLLATMLPGLSAPDEQPFVPPLPPPVPAHVVLTGFIDHLDHSTGFPDEAVRFIRQRAQQRDATADPAAFIDEALAVLSPAFRDGLAAAESGDHAAAATRFVPLAGHRDPYLAASATFFAATHLVGCERVREAHRLLCEAYLVCAPVSTYTTHQDQLAFLLGYCQAHLLDYEGAERTLARFLADYPHAAERFRSTARQMLNEIQRRQPGTIADVCDLMNYSRRELALGRTERDVIHRQDQAVALLDQLIRDAEEQEQKGKRGGQGSSQSRGRQRHPQESQSPARVSELRPGGQAERDLDDSARRALPGESWGRMPPKQRDQILQSLQKQFPSQYRDLVEQYYRQLARDAGQP